MSDRITEILSIHIELERKKLKHLESGGSFTFYKDDLKSNALTVEDIQKTILKLERNLARHQERMRQKSGHQ